MIASKETTIEIDLRPYGYEVVETLFGEAAAGEQIHLEVLEATQAIWRLR
jgi:hypothetical protein